MKRKTSKTSRFRKSRKVRKPRRSSKSRKKFGGYTISFANRHETLEDVFGKKPITPAQMTKKLWQFIKKRKLGGKN